MSRFLALDLTQLAPPDLIEEINAEQIIAEQKAWILARWEAVRATRPDLPPLDTLGLESEPMTIIVEAYAYRETLVRALVNDKARAVLLAYATGNDLDHVGLSFDVARMSENSVPEDDARYRRRIQLSPEAFSVAGPAGAYEYHALTTSMSIFDAAAFSPTPGAVHVAVIGAGIEPVSDAVISALVRRFRDDHLVPLTDSVTIRRAEIVPVDVALDVWLPLGPDAALIEATIRTAVDNYFLSRARVGMNVFPAGFIAAAKLPAVENVTGTPATPIVMEGHQIAKLETLTVTMHIVG